MQQLTSISTSRQTTHLANDWITVTTSGMPGLVAIKAALTAKLSYLLNARITILNGAATFILIIHDTRQKVAIPGRIYQHADQRYRVSLDGWLVNDSNTLLATIYKYL